MVEGMISGEGEKVAFIKNINTKGIDIETWLTSV